MNKSASPVSKYKPILRYKGLIFNILDQRGKEMFFCFFHSPILFYFLHFCFILEYSWLTMLWKFQVDSKWSSVQFSCSVVSDSLRPHESQHARPPCPSPTSRAHSDSPSSRWMPSTCQYNGFQKASILRPSAFFTVQLSHLYMTTGKTIALTRRTFVGKVMSLLLNMLSRLVITFLPRSKCLLISWLQSPSAVILEPQK